MSIVFGRKWSQKVISTAGLYSIRPLRDTIGRQYSRRPSNNTCRHATEHSASTRLSESLLFHWRATRCNSTIDAHAYALCLSVVLFCVLSSAFLPASLSLSCRHRRHHCYCESIEGLPFHEKEIQKSFYVTFYYHILALTLERRA